MGALSTLTATDLVASMCAFRDALRSHQEFVNRLNVYPVPDGDTGTNMAFTVESVVSELQAIEATPEAGFPTLPQVCKAISHGSLMGARGNSGVILSQLLRGLAGEMAAAGDAGCEAPVVARAFRAASVAADEAVMRPVEGTILTVARSVAGGAEVSAAAGHSLVEVIEAAAAAGADALARTPDMLPVLRQAGVVDAGGSGFLLLLDAVLSVVDGRPLPDPPALSAAPPSTAAFDAAATAWEVGEDEKADEFQYEVMYLLDAPDDTIPAFKEVWAGIGDSIVVVGGDGLWNCHIHTDDVGAAIEAALDAGRPRAIRVTNLLEQVEEERWVREAGPASGDPDEGPPGPPPTTSVVTVVNGEGIKRIFRSLGVHHQVVGGQSMNPSTAEILEVVEATGSNEIVILPNNKNIRPVAEQIDSLTDAVVRVVPTSGIAEGFAALLAYDPEASAAENAEAMTLSASRVIPGEITQAVRDAEGPAGPIRVGDWLGLSHDGVLVVAETMVDALERTLATLLSDQHDLVTLIEGEGSSAATTRRISEWLGDRYPDVAIEVHHGGQPLYPYLFGIE